jgi:hypothetical protein
MKRTKVLMLVSGLAVLGSPACSVDPEGGPPDSGQWPGPDAAVHPDGGGPATGCSMIDILFMVDNSDSMGCEQEQLAAAFPAFVSVLETYGAAHAPFSYRIGVTTTGTTAQIIQDNPAPVPDITRDQTGDDGVLRSILGEPSPWLDGPDPQKDIPALFSSTARVGTGGPPYEMPLQALELFLDKTAPGGPNAGFLRDRSVFALVLITDEDDCSHPKEQTSFTAPDDRCMENPGVHNLQSLPYYKSLLDARFGENQYVIVVIAGRTACSTSAAQCDGESAQHAGCHQAGVRLADFVESQIGTSAEQNGTFADLCTVDLPLALEVALGKMSNACDHYIVQ